ncbi:MAG: MaoC family dehydratase [Chloroflexota bacterium]
MSTLEIGMKASRTKTFSAADVEAFARLTGDTNPVHLDETYAATTRFGKRVVHGMLTASLISALIANDLPGPGSVYLKQTLTFTAPVYLGDTISATAEVTGFRERTRVTTLKTTCTNQDGLLVLEGEAVVIAPNQ